MFRTMKFLAAFELCLGALLVYVETAVANTQAVTAINIALDPDAAMIRHAEAANARLLKSYPNGFALDASHRPHITLLQRYVYTANLKKIYAAAGKVIATEKVANWQLQAFKYYYSPWKNLGLGGIVVAPTDKLLALQKKLIDVVAPFTAETGTVDAFFTTPEDAEINQPTIDYVSNFVSKASGEHFNPHVTIGIASQGYLKEMLAEPFEAFTFSPAGVSVYQIGNFGTARKKLKSWD